jgi:hypothetical protein
MLPAALPALLRTAPTNTRRRCCCLRQMLLGVYSLKTVRAPRASVTMQTSMTRKV